MKILIKKYIRYPSEFILFAIFYFIFKLLPLSVARKLGVSITTSLGPLFSINKLIKKNLRIAFKDQDEKWIKSTAEKVWENLGYTIAEYSHLKKILRDKINVIENDHYREAFSGSERSIIISAHNSNWEIPGMSIRKTMHQTSAIVREPNNPLINYVLKNLRDKYSLRCLSKNRIGTKQLLNNFKNGESIALLADLQLSSGINLNFFGKKMKFSSLPAQLALKSRCKIFLGWPIRKNDGKYEFEIHQSIHASDYEDTSDNVEKISEIIIAYYESMIKKYPEQYFWFHNRWKLD
jgi:KDO2-lipid IV(A) lauroyltransferase